MKYLILRCEDDARAGHALPSLLEGAKAVHLQQLAQAGAVGVIHRREGEPLVDRFQFHRGVFGLAPKDVEASPARCYAAHAQLPLKPGEAVWCCELVTQRDGTIVDPTAGGIPTNEGEVLVRALNHQLGSAVQRWELGEGAHHVFVTSDPALAADETSTLRAPELLLGKAWKRSLPKEGFRGALERVLAQAAEYLEQHPVNRVRVDLGENPGNMVWLWGAVPGEPRRTFTERIGLSGVVISSHFPMRGFASCLGLDWKSGPASYEESALRQLMKGINAFLARRDFVYVHLRLDSADPVERLCAMERLDQLVLKPLTDTLPQQGPWRLLSAIDNRTDGSVTCVAIGTGLPQHPIARLEEAHLADRALAFGDGHALGSWFTTPA